MRIALLNVIISIFLVSIVGSAVAQTATITGTVFADGKPLPSASIFIESISTGTATDSTGKYLLLNIQAGSYLMKASAIGFEPVQKRISVSEGEYVVADFEMTNNQKQLEDVVVTGTLKAVSRLESPVPVEIYKFTYFKKNPTACIFDALQNVNGVRPQLNCNICSTGDIHINGLEGPYTMVLIDGMPIVSSLATVYGLSGIPNGIVERIEIVKGPASSLYGSEAVGGLINVITKNPADAPLVSADLMATSWKEFNTDLGFKMKAGRKTFVLSGVNYFKYGNIVDNNGDNFTDVTLQDRISLFQKWNFERNNNRLFSVAARYFYEDRWGGDVCWTKAFRGGDSIYGESIYTRRWELIGNYQLPVKEKLLLSFSYNNHEQDSRYGTTPYMAQQKIAFTQLIWDKKLQRHDMLAGIALRYTYYDDNTIATAKNDTINPQNKPDKTWLPGIFLQDEISLATKHKLLLGFRYDHNSVHGNIYTPRIAWKWSVNSNNIIRLNAGTGFRVVNLFTEDHAALTGARFVEVKNELRPEKSYNLNLNYIKKMPFKNGTFAGIELSAWYTYFNNRIIADYDTDPNKIIYDNLHGFAESKGISSNIDVAFANSLKILAGVTFMDVSTIEKGRRSRQILTERFSGTWAVSYKIKKLDLAIDYTGNIYGPMRLPLLGSLDPRRAYSPMWSIQNIQLLYSGFHNFEIYGGVKNLLNWTPSKGNPFIIARTNDPFDKNVKFDANGQVKATETNPFALTFDPSYVYAPNQGIRGFLGIRYSLK